MSNILCKEGADKLSAIPPKLSIPGGTVMSPSSIRFEDCNKYIGAFTLVSVPYKYDDKSLVTHDAQDEDAAKKFKERTGKNFDKRLISAIREFATKNPNANPSQLCKPFNDEKDKLQSKGLDIVTPPTAVTKAVQKGMEISSQRSDGKYWAAVAQVLGNNDYTNSLLKGQTIVADNTEVSVDRIRSNSDLDLLKEEIKEIKKSFDKVNKSIQTTLQEIRTLYSQNRILPVQAEELDYKGNPTGKQKTVLIEVPVGIDLKKVQNLPTTERDAALKRIREESKPLRTPFDPEILNSSGITDGDLTNYKEVTERIDAVSNNPILLSSFYTTQEVAIKVGLSKPSRSTIAMIDRIQSGKPTLEDLDTINNGGFSSGILSVSKDANIPDAIRSGLNNILDRGLEYLNKPTTYIVGGEKATVGISNGIIARMEKELKAANTIKEFNKTQAVQQGYVKPLSRKAMVQRPRGITQANWVEQSAENAIANEVGALKTLGHKLSRSLSIIGIAHYGVGLTIENGELTITDDALFGSLWNMGSAMAAGNYDKAEKYAGKAAKYGALTGIETLALLGLVSGPVAIGLAVGVYFIYEASETNKKAKDEQDKRTLANVVGNVPSLAVYSISISNNELISAVSKADDNPKNDVSVQRNGSVSNKITTTVMDEYPIPRERIITGNVVVIRDQLTSDPLKGLGGTTVIAGETDKEIREKQRRDQKCRCCGPCNAGSILLDIETKFGGSQECLELFRQYGSMAKLNGSVPITMSDQDAGVMALCNDAGGCFTPDTKVMIPNGEKNINEFLIGDSVVAFDATGNLVESVVTDVFIHKNQSVYSYLFSNGVSVKSTPNHPFNTKNGFLEIGNLNIGDSVIDSNGDDITLISVENIGQHTVYNIEVDIHHTYIANKIRVHNKFNPAAAEKARRNRPPEEQPIHYTGDNWPTPSSGESFGIATGRWYPQYLCKRGLANPLVHGNWTCKEVGMRTFMPMIDDSPFGNDSPFGTNTSGYAGADASNPYGVDGNPLEDVEDLAERVRRLEKNIRITSPNQVPAPPFTAPPFTYVCSPSNPYFSIVTTIDSYLKSFPYYLTDPEIKLVKSGDLKEIISYFNEKETTRRQVAGKIVVTEGTMGYDLVLISQKYIAEIEKDERNMNERTEYLDCITSLMG